MNKIVLIRGLIIAILFTSCQKEIDWGLGGGSDALLIKTVQKTGADSVTTTYSYDASKRLTLEKIVGMSGGINVGNELKIVRDGSGVITKTIQKSDVLIAAGIDSVIRRFNYNSSNGRYTSALFDLTVSGFSITDSSAFQYDASGNISTELHYQKLDPLPYILSFKQEYIYAGNNLVSTKQYSFDPLTMTYDLIATINFTYDNKSAALKTGIEAIVITRPGYYGNNNATKNEFIDATDPANNFTDSLVYTYNASKKPLTAVSTKTPPGTISNITYYYQ
jgi:hypothetical protein